MSRGSRAAWRKLSLVVGGAILFLVGYFNGSRYAIEPLAALNSVILPKPVAITALDLPSETKKWRLVVVNPHTVRDCRDRTAALIRIHNRLAHRHDVLQQLELAWVSTARSPENYQAIANYSLTLDRVQRLLREFGVSDPTQSTCQEQPAALLDEDGRLRALLPAMLPPEIAAQELALLVDHLEE